MNLPKTIPKFTVNKYVIFSSIPSLSVNPIRSTKMMAKPFSFAGNHLENLKGQLDNFKRISPTNDIHTYFEHLNAHCYYLHVDILANHDIHLFQKPTSSSSNPGGLLIYLFDGSQPPYCQIGEATLETLKQGMLIISHKQTCKIRFSKSYRGFWGVFSMSGQWCSENFPYPYPTRSNCLTLSALSIHYINQIRQGEIPETKRNKCIRSIILNQLFYQLLIDLTTATQQSSNLNSVEQIKHYLLTHLSSPLPPLEELAQLCNMSVSTFKSKFQQSAGASAKIFFYEAQMNLAIQLLSQGFSTKEIANRLGYANASNFIHAFKRKFGVSPLKHKEVDVS